MLEIKQRRPTQETDNQPAKTNPQAFTFTGKGGNAKSKQSDSGKEGGTSKKKIHQSRHDRTNSSDKIYRMFRNRSVFSKCPSGNIP